MLKYLWSAIRSLISLKKCKRQTFDISQSNFFFQPMTLVCLIGVFSEAFKTKCLLTLVSWKLHPPPLTSILTSNLAEINFSTQKSNDIVTFKFFCY